MRADSKARQPSADRGRGSRYAQRDFRAALSSVTSGPSFGGLASNVGVTPRLKSARVHTGPIEADDERVQARREVARAVRALRDRV